MPEHGKIKNGQFTRLDFYFSYKDSCCWSSCFIHHNEDYTAKLQKKENITTVLKPEKSLYYSSNRRFLNFILVDYDKYIKSICAERCYIYDQKSAEF